MFRVPTPIIANGSILHECRISISGFITDEVFRNSRLFQFDSPIVNAWTLIGSRLTWIDLLPVRSVIKKNKTVYPTLYIGVHDEQVRQYLRLRADNITRKVN